MKLIFVLAFLALAAPTLFHGFAEADQKTPDTLTLQAGNQELRFTLEQLKQKLPTVQIQNFDAFRLEDLLGLLGNTPSAADEIVFQAADGYSPSISRSKISGHEAYVAYQEHGRPKGKGRFEKIRQGKAWISPEPYYLIWKDAKKLSEEYPSPYQLVKIEFVSFKEKYAKIFPDTSADSPEMRGFNTFKAQCIRCHSLNLIGGDIGPELNTPKNILEYWDEKTLRAFIQKVSSFRARDKMPDFPELKNTDIDALLAYFRYLRTHRSQM